MSAGVAVGVGLLGGLGAVLRVLVDRAVTDRAPNSALPLGILLVNISGALALGVLAGAGVDGDALRLVGGGLLGGYTTFSTWMVQTHALSAQHAVVNLAGSLLLGVTAVALGEVIA